MDSDYAIQARIRWNTEPVPTRYRFLPVSYIMKNPDFWYWPFEKLSQAIQTDIIDTMMIRGLIYMGCIDKDEE